MSCRCCFRDIAYYLIWFFVLLMFWLRLALVLFILRLVVRTLFSCGFVPCCLVRIGCLQFIAGCALMVNCVLRVVSWLCCGVVLSVVCVLRVAPCGLSVGCIVIRMRLLFIVCGLLCLVVFSGWLLCSCRVWCIFVLFMVLAFIVS